MKALWMSRAADGVLMLAIGSTAIGIVLFVSQIIIDVTGNH